MDSEMVAASLDVAHKDVINALPQDARIPVGWRFMDKFVQLPFVVPPIDSNNVRSFSTSLLISADRRKVIDEAAVAILQASDGTVADETNVVKVYADKVGMSTEDLNLVIDEVRFERSRQAQARVIEDFDDYRDDVRTVTEQGLNYFTGNPRESKRFLNAFRLHVFLWGDKAKTGDSKLELPIIMRWTVFMMKWPDVMRWIRRAPRLPSDVRNEDGTQGGPDVSFAGPRRATVANCLQKLEELASTAVSLSLWRDELLKSEGVPKDARWLYDEELFQFLTDRVDEFGGPLSAGVGEGLW